MLRFTFFRKPIRGAARRTNSSSPISRNAYARLGPLKVEPRPPKPPLAREATAGDLKVDRCLVEPPRIMAAARLSPPMTYRAVRTPVKGCAIHQERAQEAHMDESVASDGGFSADLVL